MTINTPQDPRADHWNARYAQDEYLFGTAANEFLVAQRHLLRRGQRALCVADGEGRNSVWLARQGLDVEAFDISEQAVAKARRLAAEHGVAVDYRVSSVGDYPWPSERFDVVAAIFIQFLYPAERPGFFQNVLHSLKPGGVLLLEGYRVEQLAYGTGGPSVENQLYSEVQLREELAGFEIELVHTEDREVHEGSSHRGLSALIEVVGRRAEDPGVTGSS